MESDRQLKDELTQKIGVLTRRETEARIIAPFVEALIQTFGKEKITPILEKTVMDLARNQGSSLAKEYGDDVSAFLETLKFWTQDGALEIDLLEKSDTKLDFNVTRCRYAEMYKALYISAYLHRVTLKSSFVSLFSSKSISSAPSWVQNLSVSRKAETSSPYSFAKDDP